MVGVWGQCPARKDLIRLAHYDLHTNDLKAIAPKLRAGDTVTLTGTLYTARDAAHKRIVAAMEQGEPLPFPLDGAAIYYAGPTPAKPGQVIGSVGPTTSGRMDPYSPALLDAGLACAAPLSLMPWHAMAACIWSQSAALAPSKQHPLKIWRSLPMMIWAANP